MAPAEEDVHDEGNCFKDSTKTCCARYVYWMSFLLLVLSIVVGAYGYFSISGRSFNPPQVASYKFKWTISPNAALGILCILGALFGVIVSILGFLLQWCMNCCFALPFAILAFVAAILSLAFGAAIVGGGATKQATQLICAQGQKYLQGHYSKYVDQKMCSANAGTGCKCASANKATWETAMNSGTAQWTASGRTKGDLDFTGSATSYKSCYDGLVASYNAGSQAEKNDALEFLTKGGYSFISSFEKQFKCAGVCFTPLFYLTRPLSDGIPTTSCDSAFLASVSGQVGPAIVAFLTAIIMLTLFGASFPLCTGKSDSNDAMGGA